MKKQSVKDVVTTEIPIKYKEDVLLLCRAYLEIMKPGVISIKQDIVVYPELAFSSSDCLYHIEPYYESDLNDSVENCPEIKRRELLFQKMVNKSKKLSVKIWKEKEDSFLMDDVIMNLDSTVDYNKIEKCLRHCNVVFG